MRHTLIWFYFQSGERIFFRSMECTVEIKRLSTQSARYKKSFTLYSSPEDHNSAEEVILWWDQILSCLSRIPNFFGSGRAKVVVNDETLNKKAVNLMCAFMSCMIIWRTFEAAFWFWIFGWRVSSWDTGIRMSSIRGENRISPINNLSASDEKVSKNFSFAFG